MPKFAPIAQRLLNSYPMWSSIRNDEQANGAQFLNVVGNQLEDMHEQLVNVEKNYTIPFANVTDLDILFKFALPKSFEFDVTNNDAANPIYSPPTVTGSTNSVDYTVTQCLDNDIESFWYNTAPTRITVESVAVTNVLADSAAVDMYGAIVTMTQAQSPYVGSVTLDEPYTRLWVQTVGGTQYIDVDANNILQRASIVITGVTRKGTIESETLVFIHDDLQPTMKEWQTVTRVEVYNINPETVTVRLLAHRFRRNQTPLLSPPQSFYSFYNSPDTKQDLETFWELGINGATKSTLKLQTWDTHDLRTRMNGFVSLDTMRSFQLNNMADVALTTANDLAVEPFSNRVWVVDNTKLYVYDGEWTLPSMNLMEKKITGAMSVMVPSTYHVTPGDPVSIEYFWQRQITDVLRHRAWVKFPNGTQYTLTGGSMVTYDSSAVVYNDGQVARSLRAHETYTLTTPGDYVFSLEVFYSNGVREIDQIIISVDTKIALAEFSFSSLAPGGILRGVDFDSDHNLWVLVDTAGVFTKMKVTLFHDVMMVDYQNKILYLREDYDQVRVT